MWETIALCELAVLMLWALAALSARRPVRVIEEGDYEPGTPRTFVGLELVCDGTAEGSYLADARTGRALVFTGCGVTKRQLEFTAGGRLGRVLLALEKVPVRRTGGE